jgi:hypothetical protein
MSHGNDPRHLIIDLMQRQEPESAVESAPDSPLPAEHDATALPLRTVYVDEESGGLIVGIDSATEAERTSHERTLNALLGGARFEVRYVTIMRDACPNKKEACRPLRGGIRVNSDNTLNLVILQRVSGQVRPQTIVSSHPFKDGIGQTVGQPNTQDGKYGEIISNPSLSHRASDAALTNISNSRTEASPYRIWRAPDSDGYIVNDFAVSDHTPFRLRVYMQGAMEPELRSGVLIQKGVTVTDKRGTLTNQVYATYPAYSGDSGAPVFYNTEFDDYVVYVGIHAGRIIEDGNEVSFYSPWEGIQGDLALNPVRK